ncbi:MAG: hypothetical protein JNL11_04460 [Bdellovibrionaceae bacterium]|nr:hypothetical protein [Pseudobdellovibrionaceae bacterium]
MKKMTIIVAVALAATSAYASKARLKALSNSPHLQDTRDILREPDQALVHGEFVTIETSGNAAGVTAAGVGGNDGAPQAEAGFVRKMNDTSALGAWLGNKTNLSAGGLTDAGSTVSLQNPLNLVYASKAGDIAWGLGLNYSNFDDKANKNKSSSMGLNASASSTSGWEAHLGLGLTGEATAADTKKFEQKSPMSLSGGYWLDTMFLYGAYSMGGGKSKDIVAGTELGSNDTSSLAIGVVNSHKKDGADFFYGVSYVMGSDKAGNNGVKTETSALPVVVGIEADATSWLVVRGSLTQNILLGSSKTTPAGGGASSETNLADSTVAAAGLGLKLGKFMVDGTLAATTKANAGKLGSDNGFLSEVGLTYQF